MEFTFSGNLHAVPDDPDQLRAYLLDLFGTDPAAYYNREYSEGCTPAPPDREVMQGACLLEGSNLTRKRALDIGAGTGGNSLFLKGRGYDVVATETSSVAAQLLRLRGLLVFEEDVGLTGIRGMFEIIVVAQVFQHMSEKETMSTIESMREHTVPGGVNVVIAYSDKNPLIEFMPFPKQYYFSAGSLPLCYSGWNTVSYAERMESDRLGGKYHFVRGVFVKPLP